MIADLRSPRNGSGYAAGPVTKAPAWHGLVAWDLLFNNLTTGLFLTAALGDLLAPEVFTPAAKVAYPVALVLLLTDLACLVLDLGDPLRFHHMLRLVKLTSPMSFGVWSLSAFSLPAFVAALLSVVPDGSTTLEWVRRIVVIVGLLPALASLSYKGVLFSTTAQPFWRDARWLGAYLTTSAMMLGSAILLGLAIVLGQEHAVVLLRPVLAATLLVSLVPLGLLVAEVRSELRRIPNHGQLARASALAFGGGMILPLILLIFAGQALLLGTVALILIGSLVARYVIVYAPHLAHEGTREAG